MNVIYHEKNGRGGENDPLLQHPTEQLEEFLRRTWDPVTAEWGVTEDPEGRPLYTLKLSDYAGEAGARLAPDELQPGDDLDYALSRLCAKLLKIRTDKIIDKMRAEGPLED